MTPDQLRNSRALQRRSLDSEIRAIRFRRAAEKIDELDAIELRSLVGDITWSVATDERGWMAIAHGIAGHGSSPTNAIVSWLHEAARQEDESAKRILSACAEMVGAA